MQILNAHQLNAEIDLSHFKFNSTEELLNNSKADKGSSHAWVAQTQAKKAALFGLKIPQPSFNILVLGEQGSGRTSLMQSAMHDVAKNSTVDVHDLVAICNFEQAQQPTLAKLPAGFGNKLRIDMDGFARALMVEMPKFVTAGDAAAMTQAAEIWLTDASTKLEQTFEVCQPALADYFKLVKQECLAYLSAWLHTTTDTENNLEGLINETFFMRFRVNNLVSVEHSETQPVIYDNDPSLVSLFGGLDNAAESATPEFLRLRAGNLHKADDGMLLLHLRDLLSDESNGASIIEKLHRFLRNGTVQIEDVGSSTQTVSSVLSNTLLNVQVKLVLIATREDFYDCLDQNPDFFDYFPIKVEFAERILANAENYAAIAGFVAQKCAQHQIPHFNRQALAVLIGALQRLEEDQTRISTNFAFLERLMLESAAFADSVFDGKAKLIAAEHVSAAVQAKSDRNRYFEEQIRDSIIDNELLIQVDGDVVGQVNGLTHIELGDASFGSPIRITARCHPGAKGLINIDREVNMSGPNHDKGIFILQNWLSASFSHLAPLSLNASLVFEQEYNGVEGDSASCAELFALLSSMANLPIQQGIAVTGALNQFGEVMPIGGVNEKIEGYFRVCLALGLNGKQGVIIPKRNQRHLLLDSAVVEAVKQGQFHIIAIDHVLEGIAYLTQHTADSVMAKAEITLAAFRKTLESNQPKKS
jgi:predicted ATP-dependent protease